MAEQIVAWRASGIGRRLLNGAMPNTVEEFRKTLPLTEYEDYADILLAQNSEMLPAEPVVWIKTTWEGGHRPIKLAPYSKEMLEVYKHSAIAIMILSGARKKGDCNLKAFDKVLYGGAPLPYATGLLPSLLNEEIQMNWLPDAHENTNLSFGERIKKGFNIAYKTGIDYLFGIGSVTNYITNRFSNESVSRSSKGSNPSVKIALKYLKAKYVSKRDGRPIIPADIFKIKGFISVGTDSRCYKQKLALAWGRMPIEIAAGTESTCIATEDHNCNGMVFFPDACFYEFIPESEMLRSLENKDYIPKTCLMNEVSENKSYELVISVLKGGAFARYRIGDVYRCTMGSHDGSLPRFTFIDRTPNIIDIAGFTRITEKTITEIIARSKLNIDSWIARKEFTNCNTPFLHMYIEIPPYAQIEDSVYVSVLTDHLSLYFKNFDSDFDDLKKLLEMDPLKLTVLKHNTIKKYESKVGYKMPRINPPDVDIIAMQRQALIDDTAPREVLIR